jgi:ATP-dependent DNA ligase
MESPITPPVAPMLAKLTRSLPAGDLSYEPKWDGFRCIAFRDGDELYLQSRNARPLNRYFPELVSSLRARLPERCVIDGEIVIATAGGLDFDALLQRIHPAGSRVERLARETPASLIVFDLLALDDRDLMTRPFADRRAELERALGDAGPPLYVTPATRDLEVARDWFHRFEGAGLDGVVAKPLAARYRPGERTMIKVKHERTADCVVGGYRVHKDGEGVGSLLLGLYDDRGELHHVGVASGLSRSARRDLLARLRPLRLGAGERHPWAAAGGEPVRVPGEPSRWTGSRDLSWVPVRPERVCEVRYDHLQGDRFRHATKLLRWRPDRDPSSCTYHQLEVVPPSELAQVFSAR